MGNIGRLSRALRALAEVKHPFDGSATNLRILVVPQLGSGKFQLAVKQNDGRINETAISANTMG